ncbi:asparaginase-domain-containing protein [Hesseltinella vesiculosa]|uniref:asparaginase n=1 Tax=Hesseltinella vesiculosa TaxID=101127 RepID=A0A1X2GX10_9FUNG|nr:asparaginase-domain-containing protein [Hesseltinella vesiculosa]
MPLSNERLLDDMIYGNAAVSHQLNADRQVMMAPDVSRVLIIYTGGTIGMKHTTEHGYIPYPNYLAKSLSKVQRFHDPRQAFGETTMSRNPSLDRLENASGSNSSSDSETERPSSPTPDPTLCNLTNTVRAVNDGKETIAQLHSLITPISLYGKRIRYSILEYDPLLDSCNMTMEDWMRIAKDIEANYEYFDAFIVLHGTDTMAYTASALSFMLEELGKTVIITGSQVPLTEVRNDAVDNLLGALTIAGHFVIPEVTLYFGKKLYRGNRTSKISAVDFEAFDSPNMPPLVDVGIDIDVRWPLVLRPTEITRFQARTDLNPYVATLRLFPGISATTVHMMLANPTRGVVLETYGAGNAPARADLLEELRMASERGVVIVNCTQCRKGLVTDVYATGKQLARVGVVAGADMTPECALTKLSYLLGAYPDDPSRVRELMTRNLRGELTVRRTHTQFSDDRNRTHVLVELLMACIAQGKGAAQHALRDWTLSNRDQQMAERSLAPLLLCSAAATSDLESIETLVDNMSGDLNLNCVDYDGRVPLHVASREGHAQVVAFLLRHGASVHIRDKSGHTPIYEALANRRTEAAKLLCQAGGHLAESEADDFGYLWLKAVQQGDLKFVKLALDCGWKINWAESLEQRRAIDVAVLERRLPMIKALLGERDLDLNLTDRWGVSVLDKVQRSLAQADIDSQPLLQEILLLINNRLAKAAVNHQ